MTTNLELLNAIDADESRLEAIAQLAAEQFIDIRGIYCLHTGKKFGTIDDSELEEAIFEEGDCDDDELADAMIVRVVASMRPSPAMNKPDHGTIREMVARRPNDALAYLLNRLYGSRQLLINRGDNWLSPMLNRIKTYNVISHTTLKFRDAYIHWLLELDSKLNLHEVTPPTFEKDRLGKWFVTKTGSQLIDVFHEAGVFEAFESWVFERLHEWDKKDSAALAQLRWAQGNRMTTSAYVRSYMEKPEIANRKHAEEYARRERAKAAKPKKPVSEKTRKQNERLASFLDLMDQVIDGKLDTSPMTPKKSKVVLGGMLFAKKDL